MLDIFKKFTFFEFFQGEAGVQGEVGTQGDQVLYCHTLKVDIQIWRCSKSPLSPIPFYHKLKPVSLGFAYTIFVMYSTILDSPPYQTKCDF